MLNIETRAFPVLYTPRLVLRQLIPEHAVALHQLRSDEEINRYLDRPASTGVDAAIAFINKISQLVSTGQSMYWVLTLAGDVNALIGTICLYNLDQENDTAELGYELMTAYQGRGLMAEAVARVIRFGFEEMNAKTIIACPSADNRKSVALITKLGFIPDATLQSEMDKEPQPVLAYSLKR